MIATDTDVTARHDAAFPFHAGAFEARLGPHAYRIPAHCFRDQSGPDVDGSACLLLQWPALEPLPPGVRTEGAWQVARCAHEFVVAADGIGVTMAYARAFLHDWKRIEGRVRALLARWRLR